MSTWHLEPSKPEGQAQWLGPSQMPPFSQPASQTAEKLKNIFYLATKIGFK